MICSRVNDILRSSDIVGRVVKFPDIVSINAIALEKQLVLFSRADNVGVRLDTRQ